MEIYVRKSSLADVDEPLLVVGLFSEEDLPKHVAALDESAGGLVSRVLESGEFRGRPKERRLLHVPAGGPERILLLGLGPRDDFTPERLRRASADAALDARGVRAGSVAFALPLGGDLPVPDQAEAIVEAASMALYDFDRYRSTPDEEAVPVAKLTFVSYDDTPEEAIGPGINQGRVAGECVAFCRDLQNTPAWDATPTWMAEQAKSLADEVGLGCAVVERDEMEREGMGGLLGVTRGSEQPPKMVILEHNAGRDDLDTICLVGKGVTFDTGGISLKPGPNMHLMKYDKSGACAVFAAMRGVALLNLPLHVVGITPLCENMPGGAAYRPGDVLTCSNGKTIEVLNTDAEGRLILADGLVRATKYAPKAIVDLATLTGACMIALGAGACGLMSNDDGLAAKLEAAGRETGERAWRLPLFPDYREQVKSDVADMKNVGGKPAGAITAACILSEFVEEYPWAHLDIAGVSWRDTDRDYLRKGGTGFGPRLLIEFLKSWRSA